MEENIGKRSKRVAAKFVEEFEIVLTDTHNRIHDLLQQQKQQQQTRMLEKQKKMVAFTVLNSPQCPLYNMVKSDSVSKTCNAFSSAMLVLFSCRALLKNCLTLCLSVDLLAIEAARDGNVDIFDFRLNTENSLGNNDIQRYLYQKSVSLPIPKNMTETSHLENWILAVKNYCGGD